MKFHKHKMIIILTFVFSWNATIFAQAPPNQPTHLEINSEKAELSLKYHNREIFSGKLFIKMNEGEFSPIQLDIPIQKGAARKPGVWITTEEENCGKVEQRIRVVLNQDDTKNQLILRGKTTASEQAFPVETRTMAQTRFPLVRNTVGLSRNLRNNAVYDRKWDWVLIGPGAGATHIFPSESSENQNIFSIEITDNDFELIFRPRFYQKYKNLHYFEPWTYDVWKESVSGWCSWWPYRAGFNQKELEEILKVLAEKNLDDYGYQYIQIDHSPHRAPGGTPESWLVWNDKWPAGMEGIAELIRSFGFHPAIWVHARFRDEKFVKNHPELFIPDNEGNPLKARYLGYAMDVTNPKTVEELIRPTYKGFRKAGYEYVKVDGLRHLMYDSYNHAIDYLRNRGYTPSEGVRRYVEIAREELGKDIYMLACWGVLPEVIGLANGCRLGGDGYGWATLHYFNSWNGVVWRSDPDHCDILPNKQGEYMGVVGGKHRTHYLPLEGDIRDTIIRPAFASFAGSVLMLSDKAEVYENDKYLKGVKRSAPVLFTVPGQLYDFSPEKSNLFITQERTVVKTGQGPRLTDAPRWDTNCPFWMLEIDKSFENWNVLARFNWNKFELSEMEVKFSDLGLPGEEEYLVYEFWDQRFVGQFKDEFPVIKTEPRCVQMYAIRKKLDCPQIVSTSRHISQGSVDLLDVKWNGNNYSLSGKSKVVQQDPYTLTLHVPDEYSVKSATMNRHDTEMSQDKNILTITHISEHTKTIKWTIDFEREK